MHEVDHAHHAEGQIETACHQRADAASRMPPIRRSATGMERSLSRAEPFWGSVWRGMLGAGAQHGPSLERCSILSRQLLRIYFP